MTDDLGPAVACTLAVDVPAEVTAAARSLAASLGGVAVLFYGSVLRTRALDDVLDFYMLTGRREGSVMRRLGLRWLWPDVSFHEIDVGGRRIRAKVATMPLATFARAATGDLLDTTLWVRFAQPTALVWADGEETRHNVERAVGQATMTAARFAAALGPVKGRTIDYWTALLRQTYRAELRVERPGREAQILGHAPEHFDTMLPLAWAADGIGFDREGDALTPHLDDARRRTLLRAWRRRAHVGKPLNMARLVKAAFTFDGAARYGVWKIARHTGIEIELTPWRERHPVLAGPGVLWRVFRDRPR